MSSLAPQLELIYSTICQGPHCHTVGRHLQCYFFHSSVVFRGMKREGCLIKYKEKVYFFTELNGKKKVQKKLWKVLCGAPMPTWVVLPKDYLIVLKHVF